MVVRVSSDFERNEKIKYLGGGCSELFACYFFFVVVVVFLEAVQSLVAFTIVALDGFTPGDNDKIA